MAVVKSWSHILGCSTTMTKTLPYAPPVRFPRSTSADQPSLHSAQSKKRRIVANHVLRLLRIESDEATEIGRCHVSPGDVGELRNSFRFFRFTEPVRLKQNVTYILLMSTEVADGDCFRDAASFDGLSPLVHPDVIVLRSMLVRGEDVTNAAELPAFEDLSNSYSPLSARRTDASVPTLNVRRRKSGAVLERDAGQ